MQSLKFQLKTSFPGTYSLKKSVMVKNNAIKFFMPTKHTLTYNELQ